ncbi:MAG: hypothetical protein ACI4PC_07265 [Oscillospiraceae bacterium]
MSISGFPTSSDIYLEVNGRKVAVVQSYKAAARKSEKTIEAFGESQPVATIAGQPSYTLELTRLYATESAAADGINFHDLKDFSLVIVKPDRRVVYTGCNWSRIDENGELNDLVAEKISLIAAGRVEAEA